jgi:hypothetical protein
MICQTFLVVIWSLMQTLLIAPLKLKYACIPANTYGFIGVLKHARQALKVFTNPHL